MDERDYFSSRVQKDMDVSWRIYEKYMWNELTEHLLIILQRNKKKDLKEMAEFEGIQSMQKYLFQAVVKQAADNGFRY